MGSPFAFFTLSSLILLFANTIEARPDPEEYWQGLMKDQPMPEAIQGLIHHGSVTEEAIKNYQKQPFVKDSESRPSATAYHDDDKLTEEKSFAKDFEPRPNFLAYHDDAGLKREKFFAKDFKPRPNFLAYHDDAGLKRENSFAKDFKPRPNFLAYHDDAGLK